MPFDRFEERKIQIGRRDSENRTHRFAIHVASGKRVGLVKERERIAHRPVRLFGDHPERFGIGRNLFLFADILEASRDLPCGQALEVEPLDARKNRLRHLVHFGRREDEDYVRRWLFQRLEKRVESALGKHVDFVDDKDLVLSDHRRVLRLFQEIADVIDARVGRRIDFDHVHRMPARNVLATFALAAGNQRISARTVQRLRKDSRRCRLADATRSRKQERMMQPPAGNRIFDRLRDMLLADQIVEGFRTPFTSHCHVSHNSNIL